MASVSSECLSSESWRNSVQWSILKHQHRLARGTVLRCYESLRLALAWSSLKLRDPTVFLLHMQYENNSIHRLHSSSSPLLPPVFRRQTCFAAHLKGHVSIESWLLFGCGLLTSHRLDPAFSRIRNVEGTSSNPPFLVDQHPIAYCRTFILVSREHTMFYIFQLSKCSTVECQKYYSPLKTRSA